VDRREACAWKNDSSELVESNHRPVQKQDDRRKGGIRGKGRGKGRGGDAWEPTCATINVAAPCFPS
jgi:hypothetical protein